MIMTFKDWLKSQDQKTIEATKEKYESQQMGFGKLFEYNFIKVATNIADTNSYIKVSAVPKEVDYFFGADFKLSYKDPRDEDVNNMSIYVDITSNKEKKYYTSLSSDGYTLSNGCIATVGYKIKNNFFKYNKPVLVIMLDTAKVSTPIFKEEDLLAIFFMCLQHIKYLSYKKPLNFGGEPKQGGGKRASELVDTYPGKKVWVIE